MYYNMNTIDLIWNAWQRRMLLMLVILAGPVGMIQAQTVQTDRHPKGYVYLEDRFDWVTAQAGGADYLNGKFANAGPRIDKMPQPFDELLDESGWKSSSNFVYFRLGYLQIGRRTDAGDLISPKLERRHMVESLQGYTCQGIELGKKTNVEVSFDVAIYQGVKGNKDTGEVIFEVLNAGQLKDGNPETVVKVRSWNKWKNVTIRVYGVTCDTQFCIRSAQPQEKGVASRFFIDNFKVTKIK